MAVVVWPQTLASLPCRDGARRVFIDQAGIGCIKREAPFEVLGELFIKGELHPTKNRF